jgi:hypothetical protein
MHARRSTHGQSTYLSSGSAPFFLGSFRGRLDFDGGNRILRLRRRFLACLVATGFACLSALHAAPRTAHEKSVWNYDGGILMVTDGSVPDGPCFRISGRVTSPHFFDNLKRIDNDNGTQFRRGSEILTSFPDHVTLGFVVYDHPCSTKLEDTTRAYLSRQLMSSLHMFLYWKRGVDLRPIHDVASKFFSVDPLLTRTAAHARDLPERLVWSYEFEVPSADVPLTDSLVLILRCPDGHIAARVAARM